MLFEIKKDGLSESTFLFGTLHIAPNNNSKIVQILDHAEELLSRCDVFYSEVDSDKQQKDFGLILSDSGIWDLQTDDVKLELAPLRQALLLPNNLTLKEYLPADTLESLIRFASKSGNTRDKVESVKYQPWLMALQIVKAKTISHFENISIDSKVYGSAKKMGKRMEPLEVPGVIYPKIYGHTNSENQAHLLTVAIEYDPINFFNQLLQAYIMGNYQLFYDLDSSRFLPDEERTPYWQQKIKSATFDDRNTAWVEKIASQIGCQKLFVTFGASHLGGKKGIISLLLERGYIVRPISTP